MGHNPNDPDFDPAENPWCTPQDGAPYWSGDPAFRLPPEWQAIWDEYPELQHKADPLVISFDGDFLPTAAGGGVYFDWHNDGFAEYSAWITASNQAFLVRDLDGDGKITHAGEMFGTDTVDGFDILAEYDSNQDGFIDNSDVIWGDLLLWFDANTNGLTDDGELVSLSSQDIDRLSLSFAQEDEILLGDTLLARTSEAQWWDSATSSFMQTATLGSVYYQRDSIDTRYIEDYDLKLATLFLPTLRGYMEAKDLFIEASLNDDLLDSIVDFQATYTDAVSIFMNFDQALSDFTDIMYLWAGLALDFAVDFVQQNHPKISANDNQKHRHVGSCPQKLRKCA